MKQDTCVYKLTVHPYVKSLVDTLQGLEAYLDKIISYCVCCTLHTLHPPLWSWKLIRRFADWLAGLLRILHLLSHDKF